MIDPLPSFDATLLRAIAPEPDLLCWEWAEANRELPPDSARPGPKSYDYTPYLKGPAEALSLQEPYEKVVLMKGSQIGATDLGADWIGHSIHLSPSTILCVWPTVEFAKRKSRELIDPLTSETKVLQPLVSRARAKDADNTILVKKFPGGRLVITGANSGIGLRSTAAQRVFLDELDAFAQVAGKEGHPVRLALRATRTFKGRRKIFIASTPLIEATSLILEEWKRCDRACYYHLPCPHCGFLQRLVWSQMRWETEGEGAGVRIAEGSTRYLCIECKRAIHNHDKAAMLAEGRWVDRWDNGGRLTIGFHISALYSPVGWYSWDEAALDFVQSRGKPAEEQTFDNTVLGRAVVETKEKPAWRPLYDRREPYVEGVVQPGCVFLTMAVDVQGEGEGRLEVELKGWGRDGRAWSLLYRWLVGDIMAPVDRGVWVQLDQLLMTKWPAIGGDGFLDVWCCAIDSGAYPQQVYAWARRHTQPDYSGGRPGIRVPRTVMVVKGRDHWTKTLLISEKVSGEEQKRGLKVIGVGVSKLKKELYHTLRQAPIEGREPAGYRHWPATEHYDERYFKGLTAEDLKVRRVQGLPKLFFELAPGVRNEPLDLDNYNRAAAAACGMDAYLPAHWDRMESQLPKSLLRREEGMAGAKEEGGKPASAAEPQSPAPSLPPAVPSVSSPSPQPWGFVTIENEWVNRGRG